MKNFLSRRALIAAGVSAPLVLDAQAAVEGPGAPPYTVSINIELMFPRTMPRGQRVEMVAAHGFKAYSFWTASEEEQDAMLKVQEQTGMKCASITGPASRVVRRASPSRAWSRPIWTKSPPRIKMAERFGGAQPIIFVGRTQTDVPVGNAACADRQRAEGRPATSPRSTASRW